MSTDYNACAKQLFEQTNQITKERASWMQRILFLSATLFGILISLHSSSPASQYTRLCFAFACIALALGILLLSMASYHHIAVQTRARNKFAEEVHSARRECRAVEPVRVDKISFFVICEACAYICLLVAVLLLAAYSLLKVV